MTVRIALVWMVEMASFVSLANVLRKKISHNVLEKAFMRLLKSSLMTFVATKLSAVSSSFGTLLSLGSGKAEKS